jgi:glycosyltransferase involved in cell wall biosynthesis
MRPLAEALGAEVVLYNDGWQRWGQRRSWRLGMWMRQLSRWWYGSQWMYLLPIHDEWRLRKAMPRACDIAHFLFGEFAAPRYDRPFRDRAKAVVGTFHASARRLPVVLKAYRCFGSFDAITLMSESQRPFFLEQGISPEALRVILHGVDSHYFVPPIAREPRSSALRGLLVGSTERDHAMMNKILRALPKGVLDLTILTAGEQRSYYYGNDVPHARFPQHLNDADLLQAYQQADVLVMPMLDCTANNAVLESMACGTPVMVNRVGGIPEYVDPRCNVVIEEHTVDAWVDRLLYWREHRDELEAMRDQVRNWAEPFDWGCVAPKYVDLYNELLGYA